LFDEIGVPNHDRETREEEVRETVVHTVAAATMLTAHGSSLRRCPTP
jgi:hypothetical protein